MSRIGKLPISIPQGVTVNVSDKNEVTVKGKLGELKQKVHPSVKISQEDGHLHFSVTDNSKQSNAYHGLYRALVHNMVVGVSEGFTTELEMVGVGYKATATGQVIEFTLGFSHYIYLELCPEIKVETTAEKGKNPMIKLTSFDKQLLGQVVAKIRSFRAPEPYKGKGIKFKDEVLRRKAGKTAAKK
ncbi:MAG: 50S ribosomal protein L6 [Bacteroidales bacterium]|nr:50S ribosomal protein L6 [Bacteroidales bacterium]